MGVIATDPTGLPSSHQDRHNFAVQGPGGPTDYITSHFGSPFRISLQLGWGHGGVRCTYNRLSAEFYWKGLKRSVQTFVSQYDVRQCWKYESTSPVGLL